MKIKMILLCSLILSIASCNKDDDNTPESISIVGTWNVVSITSPESFDLNGDGEESNDILEEVPCFTSTSTFAADGIVNSTTSDLEILVSGENFTTVCLGSSSYSSTYVVEGNTITTTDEDGTVTANITLTSSQLTVEGETEDFGYATVVLERQ